MLAEVCMLFFPPFYASTTFMIQLYKFTSDFIEIMPLKTCPIPVKCVMGEKTKIFFAVALGSVAA